MANVFTKKKMEAELLEKLMDTLESEYQWCCKEYRKVGTKQKQEWKDGQYVKVYDEETEEPVMVDDYDYVIVSDEELSEEAKLKKQVIENLMKKMEKML